MSRVAIILLMAMVGGCATRSSTARDYHFAAAGNDESGDGSLLRPFRTIDKIASLSLESGDRLLFEGGQVFTGNLQVSGRSLYVGSFGAGRATIDARRGSALLSARRN